MAENTKLLSAEPFVSKDSSLDGFRNNSRNDYGLLLPSYRFFRYLNTIGNCLVFKLFL